MAGARVDSQNLKFKVQAVGSCVQRYEELPEFFSVLAAKSALTAAKNKFSHSVPVVTFKPEGCIAQKIKIDMTASALNELTQRIEVLHSAIRITTQRINVISLQEQYNDSVVEARLEQKNRELKDLEAKLEADVASLRESITTELSNDSFECSKLKMAFENNEVALNKSLDYFKGELQPYLEAYDSRKEGENALSQVEESKDFNVSAVDSGSSVASADAGSGSFWGRSSAGGAAQQSLALWSSEPDYDSHGFVSASAQTSRLPSGALSLDTITGKVIRMARRSVLGVKFAYPQDILKQLASSYDGFLPRQSGGYVSESGAIERIKHDLAPHIERLKTFSGMKPKDFAEAKLYLETALCEAQAVTDLIIEFNREKTARLIEAKTDEGRLSIEAAEEALHAAICSHKNRDAIDSLKLEIGEELESAGLNVGVGGAGNVFYKSVEAANPRREKLKVELLAQQAELEGLEFDKIQLACDLNEESRALNDLGAGSPASRFSGSVDENLTQRKAFIDAKELYIGERQTEKQTLEGIERRLAAEFKGLEDKAQRVQVHLTGELKRQHEDLQIKGITLGERKFQLQNEIDCLYEDSDFVSLKRGHSLTNNKYKSECYSLERKASNNVCRVSTVLEGYVASLSKLIPDPEAKADGVDMKPAKTGLVSRLKARIQSGAERLDKFLSESASPKSKPKPKRIHTSDMLKEVAKKLDLTASKDTELGRSLSVGDRVRIEEITIQLREMPVLSSENQEVAGVLAKKAIGLIGHAKDILIECINANSESKQLLVKSKQQESLALISDRLEVRKQSLLLKKEELVSKVQALMSKDIPKNNKRLWDVGFQKLRAIKASCKLTSESFAKSEELRLVRSQVAEQNSLISTAQAELSRMQTEYNLLINLNSARDDLARSEALLSGASLGIRTEAIDFWLEVRAELIGLIGFNFCDVSASFRDVQNNYLCFKDRYSVSFQGQSSSAVKNLYTAVILDDHRIKGEEGDSVSQLISHMLGGADSRIGVLINRNLRVSSSEFLDRLKDTNLNLSSAVLVNQTSMQRLIELTILNFKSINHIGGFNPEQKCKKAVEIFTRTIFGIKGQGEANLRKQYFDGLMAKLYPAASAGGAMSPDLMYLQSGSQDRKVVYGGYTGDQHVNKQAARLSRNARYALASADGASSNEAIQNVLSVHRNDNFFYQAMRAIARLFGYGETKATREARVIGHSGQYAAVAKQNLVATCLKDCGVDPADINQEAQRIAAPAPAA